MKFVPDTLLYPIEPPFFGMNALTAPFKRQTGKMVSYRVQRAQRVQGNGMTGAPQGAASAAIGTPPPGRRSAMLQTHNFARTAILEFGLV